ncbi:MAG: hypothetical protein Q4C49_12495 [Bacillota bacterium]|nr:hypothetical protein [Bacillota bacterium]
MLKMACEGIKYHNDNQLKSIYSYEDIFEGYLNNIKEIIDEDGLYPRFNFLEKALLAIVSHSNYMYGQLDYVEAYKSVYDAVCNRCDDLFSKRLLDSLIENNILSYYDDGDVQNIYFSYEKLGDYFFAKYLVENVDLVENILSDVREVEENKGSLNILGALLPDKKGMELFELVDRDYISKIERIISEVFVNSLLWRNHFTLNKKTEFFIDNYLFKFTELIRYFFKSLIKMSFEDNHSLNGKYLYDKLISMELKEREYLWSIGIYNDDSLLHILDWTWENVDMLNIQQKQNFLIVFAWSLSSSNMKIRDTSTKVISILLISAPSLIKKLFELFKNVDDDYILERMYASIYGAITYLENDKSWSDIIYELYEKIYCGKETYPNIQIRKYCYLIIDYYCNIHEYNMKKEFPKIFNTKSVWYDYAPSEDDIENLEKSISERYGEKSSAEFSCTTIISSMATEESKYRMYGDFGRYVFSSIIYPWKNQLNEQELSNIITSEILKEKYDFDNFSDFDMHKIKRSIGKNTEIERIGKKYQWIGIHRMLARLVDNYPPYTVEYSYSDDGMEKIDFENEELYLETLKEPEIIGETKRYNDFSTIDLYASINTVDPTYLNKRKIKNKYSLDISLFKHTFSEVNIETNIINEHLNRTRIIDYDGKQYLNVYTFANQRLQKGVDIKLSWSMSGCLVKEEDVETFYKNYRHINNNGIPYSEFRNCYFKDFSKSAIFKRLKSQNNEDNMCYHVSHIPIIEEYIWDKYRDESIIEESINIPLLSEELVKYFDLNFQNGCWTNGDSLVAFINQYENVTSVFIDFKLISDFTNMKGYKLLLGEYFELRKNREYKEVWQLLNIDSDSINFYISDERYGVLFNRYFEE